MEGGLRSLVLWCLPHIHPPIHPYCLQAAANQLMDFHPVGLMSLIRGFAKLNFTPDPSFLKVGA